MRLKTKVMTIAGALLGALWPNNTSVFLRLDGTPTLLAHRGVHQEYDRTNLGRDDCTATRVFAPINPVLENTIPSMRAPLRPVRTWSSWTCTAPPTAT